MCESYLSITVRHQLCDPPSDEDHSMPNGATSEQDVVTPERVGLCGVHFAGENVLDADYGYSSHPSCGLKGSH